MNQATRASPQHLRGVIALDYGPRGRISAVWSLRRPQAADAPHSTYAQIGGPGNNASGYYCNGIEFHGDGLPLPDVRRTMARMVKEARAFQRASRQAQAVAGRAGP